MRPVGAYWGHFAAKSAEISTNGSTRSELSWLASGSAASITERCRAVAVTVAVPVVRPEPSRNVLVPMLSVVTVPVIRPEPSRPPRRRRLASRGGARPGKKNGPGRRRAQRSDPFVSEVELEPRS